MKRKVFIPGFVVFLMLGISIASLTAVYAQERNTTYPPVVQKLAEKFNLNPSEVQDAFKEIQDEHRADRFAQFEERLNDFVSEGKITEEQKQKILDKHEEMQAKRESLMNLDPAARREEMQQIHQEFKEWSDENGINLGEFGFAEGFHGRGFRDRMMPALN